ncbi:MAG: hypothetical protein BWY19_01219 [bacterium ADurb.Bin212]|nr:MAG: hypothetical protein BWY19_01219 [bacterium ADurb.Bin212]
MAQLRIHNLTEAEEVTGDEKLVLDDSSFSNALSLTLNKLATYILSKTESVMHAETMYYNGFTGLADGGSDYVVGAPVCVEESNSFVGISLDDAALGEPFRVAYAGKCQVLVKSDVDVVAGNFAIMDDSHEIKIGGGTEVINRVGVFLETSAGGEDRLVWVLLKL